jgi:hypothetical protein
VIEEDESHFNGLTMRNMEESPQINIKEGGRKCKKSGSIVACSYFVPPYQKIYTHELP